MFGHFNSRNTAGICAKLNQMREEGMDFTVIQIVEKGEMWIVFYETHDYVDTRSNIVDAAYEEQPQESGEGNGEGDTGGQQEPVAAGAGINLLSRTGPAPVFSPTGDTPPKPSRRKTKGDDA